MSDYKKDINSFKTGDIINQIELTWLSLGSAQQHWTGLQNHGGAPIGAQLEEECSWGHDRLDAENWIRVLFPRAGHFKRSLSCSDVTLTPILFAPDPTPSHSAPSDEFTRAVYVATGIKLTHHLVHTVFKIFDEDRDNKLSHKEFIGVMKERLHRGDGVSAGPTGGALEGDRGNAS